MNHQIAEIDERRDALAAEARTLLDRAATDLTGTDLARFEEIEAELGDLATRRRSIEAVIAAFRAGNVETMVTLDRDPARDPRDRIPSGGPWAGLHDGPALTRSLGPAEVRSRALSAVERVSPASDPAREALTRMVEKFDTPTGDLARQVLYTTDPGYQSAFFRLILGDSILTAEETRAVRAVRDLQRAMSLTDTAGGFLIPAQLDPAVLITGDGSQSDIRQISRNVVATGDVWSGVSAAQVSASWDAEAEEVSDDAPTLAQPQITVHMSRVFVPYSIEVGMDAANFSESVVEIMVDAQRNLEATALATGSGSGEPFGIVTALAGTASEVTSATTDTFDPADVYAIWDALPARYKDNPRTAWLANELGYTLIRQFASDTDPDTFWTDLGGGRPRGLIGRPTYSSSAMDGTVTATQDNYLLILGDFANYVIANRLGFTVEPIQHLFGTTANRPTGQRGFFGYARLGADSVADGAFRLLNVT